MITRLPPPPGGCSRFSSALRQGWLEPVSPDSWPQWAREHTESCPACRQLMSLDRGLAGVAGLLSHPVEHQSTPTLASLRRRLGRRAAAPPAAMVPDGAPMEERYRSTGIELRRTAKGVQGWHPAARSLSLFALLPDGQPKHLRTARATSPGVGLDVEYSPAEPHRILAIATTTDGEPDLWQHWLKDWLREDPCPLSPPDDPTHRTSFAMLPVRADDRLPSRPPTTDPEEGTTSEVQALLKKGASAGRSGDIGEAAAGYRDALDRATATGDHQGRIKATAGLVMALHSTGFWDDAQRLLAESGPGALDRSWNGWICHQRVLLGFLYDDLEESQRWLERARRHDQATEPWLLVQELLLARARRDHASLLKLGLRLNHIDLPHETRAALDCIQGRTMIAVGRLKDAAHILSKVDATSPLLPVRLQHLMAQVELAAAEGRPFHWDAALHPLLSAIDARPLSFSLLDEQNIVELADVAWEHGQDRWARIIFRHRFLESRLASAPDAPLLAVAGYPGRLLAMSPMGAIRRLSISRGDLQRLVDQARQELNRDRALQAIRTLTGLLFPEGRLPEGTILTASDGCLASAPLLGLALTLAAQSSSRAPALWELGTTRRPRAPRAPDAPEVIRSLADPMGDLPFASNEVRREEASTWLRGQDVTRKRLAEMGPCGLLHLGLHTRRERGLVELLFADGAMSATEIAALRLQGSPVVLLSGCATACESSGPGVERSLAQAFLMAGASTVVATRWPVQDKEIYKLMRALVESWPCQEPARQVAHASRELKEQGAPASLWASPVVY